jgi:hypothetical protein
MKTSCHDEPKAMVHGPGASLNELSVKLLLNRVAVDAGQCKHAPDRLDRRVEMLQSQDDASTIQ